MSKRELYSWEGLCYYDNCNIMVTGERKYG